MNDENSLFSVHFGSPVMTAGPLVPSLTSTMRELEGAIRGIAGANLPVLLVGEKGTGKEVIAREIHRCHGGEAPFLCVRCLKNDPRTFASLLREAFNHVETLPQKPRTLFLDEIGDLGPTCQSVLIDVLAGDDGAGDCDHSRVRLISSTCQNLEEEIDKKHFREDLFYRLNGICLRVPPLRRRKEDIPVLLEFFLKKHAQELDRAPVLVRPETMQALLQHPWPGNVRELEEVARRILLSDERTAVAGLNNTSDTVLPPRKSSVPTLKEAARLASRQVERELILKMLARTRWNRKRAARELGISYKALLYKLKQIAFDDSGEP